MCTSINQCDELSVKDRVVKSLTVESNCAVEPQQRVEEMHRQNHLSLVIGKDL